MNYQYIKIDEFVKSFQGRHSRVRGDDKNRSVIFYEFVKINLRLNESPWISLVNYQSIY